MTNKTTVLDFFNREVGVNQLKGQELLDKLEIYSKLFKINRTEIIFTENPQRVKAIMDSLGFAFNATQAHPDVFYRSFENGCMEICSLQKDLFDTFRLVSYSDDPLSDTDRQLAEVVRVGSLGSMKDKLAEAQGHFSDYWDLKDESYIRRTCHKDVCVVSLETWPHKYHFRTEVVADDDILLMFERDSVSVPRTTEGITVTVSLIKGDDQALDSERVSELIIKYLKTLVDLANDLGHSIRLHGPSEIVEPLSQGIKNEGAFTEKNSIQTEHRSNVYPSMSDLVKEQLSKMSFIDRLKLLFFPK